jgi:hypothetical protein
VIPGVSNWVQGLDLNQQPSGYETDDAFPDTQKFAYKIDFRGV